MGRRVATENVVVEVHCGGAGVGVDALSDLSSTPLDPRSTVMSPLDPPSRWRCTAVALVLGKMLSRRDRGSEGALRWRRCRGRCTGGFELGAARSALHGHVVAGSELIGHGAAIPELAPSDLLAVVAGGEDEPATIHQQIWIQPCRLPASDMSSPDSCCRK